MQTGFTKENAFMAFLATDKACGHCRECNQNRCHIRVAQTVMTHLSETGEKKVRDMLPEDILSVLRSLPVEMGRVDKYRALTAFDTVSKICDDCPVEKHGPLCGINVTLTALGTLLYGSSFQTQKDKLIGV